MEKRRLTARVAELEGRLHELIAVAQHNMVRGVNDGSDKAAKVGKAAKDGKAPAGSQARADGRTLTLDSTAAMPPKAGFFASAGKAASLRYDMLEVAVRRTRRRGPRDARRARASHRAVHLARPHRLARLTVSSFRHAPRLTSRASVRPQASTASPAGGVAEGGGAVAYTGQLRRTATKDGVGMVLVGVGGGDENREPALPPPLRTDSSESKRKLEHSGAPATDGESDDDDDHADVGHPFTAAAQAQGEPKRARGSGSERALEPLLLSAKQPVADAQSAPASDDRTKAIAAKVAARQLEAATRKPAAGKGILGLSFARKAKPDVPVVSVGPTPIAARTRLRGGMK